MPKWTNPDILDAALGIIASSDELAVCTAQPSTFFQAVNPPAWIAETAYSLDGYVRPMVDRNGFTYISTAAGTSGSNEPVWPVTDGQTVQDGTVTWIASTSLCTVNTGLTASDFVISAGSEEGRRKLTILPKTGMTVHTTGSASHLAVISKATKTLLMVTTIPEQVVTAGNLVNTAAFVEEFGAAV